MTVDTDIYTTLSGAAAVTALAALRLYPGRAPQDSALPYVVWVRVATTGDAAHDVTTDPGLYRSSFQFTVLAETIAEVDALIEQVRIALLTADAVGHASSLDTRRDIYESVADLYRADLDITFWHTA